MTETENKPLSQHHYKDEKEAAQNGCQRRLMSGSGGVKTGTCPTQPGSFQPWPDALDQKMCLRDI